MTGKVAGTRVLPGVLVVVAAVLCDWAANVKPLPLALWTCAGMLLIVRVVDWEPDNSPEANVRNPGLTDTYRNCVHADLSNEK